MARRGVSYGADQISCFLSGRFCIEGVATFFFLRAPLTFNPSLFISIICWVLNCVLNLTFLILPLGKLRCNFVRFFMYLLWLCLHAWNISSFYPHSERDNIPTKLFTRLMKINFPVIFLDNFSFTFLERSVLPYWRTSPPKKTVIYSSRSYCLKWK